MKKIFITLLLISTKAYAWNCSIECRVQYNNVSYLSASGSTYEDARASLYGQCRPPDTFTSGGCGKISDYLWECKGQCSVTTYEKHYLTGSGDTQYTASADAVNNCSQLVQRLSPGTSPQYTVGACGP